MQIAPHGLMKSVQHSALLFHPRAGHLVAAGSETHEAKVSSALVDEVQRQLRETILQKNYPCVASLQAVAREDYAVGFYGLLGSGTNWRELRADLLTYVAEQRQSRSLYRTMFAVFPGSEEMNEETFEAKMWHELSLLTSAEERDRDWASSATNDPASPAFVFSLAGEPLFVVGLHPSSSRRGRRFPFTGLVFNAFAQFEDLERTGAYERMVTLNRTRDMTFDGSVNPMVEKYGDHWEAIQFSGRLNSAEWKCPFQFMTQAQKK